MALFINFFLLQYCLNTMIYHLKHKSLLLSPKTIVILGLEQSCILRSSLRMTQTPD